MAIASKKILGLPVITDSGIVDTDAAPIVASGTTSKMTFAHWASAIGKRLIPAGRTITSLLLFLTNNAGYNPKDYGAVGDGIANDTVAIQNTFVAAQGDVVAFPKGTFKFDGTLVVPADNFVIKGRGNGTVLNYIGAGVALNFNSKSYVTAKRFNLTTTGTVGIDLPISSHNHSIRRVHVIGGSVAGIRGADAFYGEISHCDFDTNEIGLLAISGYNGNHIHSNSFRQNHVGVKLAYSGTAGPAGNIFTGNVLESARASSTYAVWILSANSNVFQGNRLEYTVGTTHILVDSDGTHVAQFNQFTSTMFEGTISSMIIGDGVGADQILGTTVSGGRGGLITINSDADDTRLMITAAAFPTTPVDNGVRSVIDRQGNLSYSSGITGGTTSPTATFKYSRNGDIATVWIQQLTVTSNSTACTLTGLPALVTPKANAQINTVPIFDNGVLVMGAAKVNTDGTITLSKGLGGAGNDFTAAGGKGISGCVLNYKII